MVACGGTAGHRTTAVDWWSSDAAARGQAVMADLRCDPETGQLDAVLRALLPGTAIAVFPPPRRTDHAAAARFTGDYMQRFKRPAQPEAFRIFEAATNHLLGAINIGGPDREAVRRVLVTVGRDIEGERHCQQVPLEPDQAILGKLQGGKWDLYTVSDLGLTGP
jgi:hypothetical protein